ncbi:Golgi SNAP receptor complex member 1-like isoform X4, partial [Dinothrombium tinctorium]
CSKFGSRRRQKSFENATDGCQHLGRYVVNAPLALLAYRPFTELRREARHIENEVDSKLLSFSKLATNELNDHQNAMDTTPLLDNSQDAFHSMSSEIEHLIAKLTDINNRMSEYSKQITNPNAVYILQRHSEILNDYTKEFQKTKSRIMAQIDRKQLLSPLKRVE